MKIEEILLSDKIRMNRKAGGGFKLPNRSWCKRVLVVVFGALMCVGSYLYGHESNIQAMKNLEDKLSSIESSFHDIHRAKRDAIEGNTMNHNINKRGAVDQEQEVITHVRGLSGGAVYTRWGRRDCPVDASGTSLIYEGVAAGAHYTHSGGGANVLCADLNVSYTTGRFVDANQGSSYLYGLEYRDAVWTHSLFDMSDIEGGTFSLFDVPCTVCFAHGRYTNLMIPGRDSCPNGWTKEYSGYILSSAHSHKHSTDYLCVDEKPQVVPGSDGDQGGGLLYIVETQCPSLQCGPYVAGRELRCVVCTI